jgi:hypothetical protein
MSNEKMTIRNQVVKPAMPAANDQEAIAGEKIPSPEVVKLELDDNDDFGSDPYNHTGSHCVLKLDDA